jgi:hypothetical protein
MSWTLVGPRCERPFTSPINGTSSISGVEASARLPETSVSAAPARTVPSSTRLQTICCMSFISGARDWPSASDLRGIESRQGGKTVSDGLASHWRSSTPMIIIWQESLLSTRGSCKLQTRTRANCHYANVDPINGCQIGTQRPILQAPESHVRQLRILN